MVADVQNVCDCHMHIFDDQYAVAPGATLKPPNALVSDYKKLRASLGLTRCVVVQPSTYGVDNRCMLNALAQFGDSARGVAVVNDSVSDTTLSELAKGGVKGIRFNLVQAGATSLAMLQPLAERVSDFGWHIQMHCTADMLVQNYKVLAGLPVPIVLDHMARIRADQIGTHPAHKAVLDLLDNGKTWMKLSAPYLNGWSQGDAPETVGRLVQDLIRAAPDRLVWGSDWPHVTESDKPDDQQLFEQFKRWIDDPSFLEKIFRDNPKNLYGFIE